MIRNGLTIAALAVLLGTGGARGQGLNLGDPKALGDALKKVAGKAAPGPATAGAPAPKEVPKATVAEVSGPIQVKTTVTDAQVAEKLRELLPSYPGVVDVHVKVRHGVVTLSGHVTDDDTRDRLSEFVRRVQGVNLVINRAMTDKQVLTGVQRALKELRSARDVVEHTWLLALLALAVLFGSVAAARAFNAYSETLLVPFSGNTLLRSVLGSILSGAIMTAGLFAALSVLGLTQVVLSVLGLAGVVALAVGFAFRDITENFIASVLLGVRRPFRVGDFVEVAGKAGVVKTLNTRATVLVTLDGDQVRIPNATVFKEVMVNKSAFDTSRGLFDVVIPYEASTTAAQEAINAALKGHDGLLNEPPPRALVEELGPSGVKLRVYYWVPTRGIDGFKVASDVKLLAKVALQQAGITPSPPGVRMTIAGCVPLTLAGAGPVAPDPVAPPALANGTANGRQPNGASKNGHAAAPAPASAPVGAATAEQVNANLRADAKAAEAAADAPATRDQGLDHVMNVATAPSIDEGENLLERPTEKRPDKPEPPGGATATNGATAGATH